jgi:hypothetical protein
MADELAVEEYISQLSHKWTDSVRRFLDTYSPCIIPTDLNDAAKSPSLRKVQEQLRVEYMLDNEVK